MRLAVLERYSESDLSLKEFIQSKFLQFGI
jgi:hypothetical protein